LLVENTATKKRVKPNGAQQLHSKCTVEELKKLEKLRDGEKPTKKAATKQRPKN